MNLKNPSVRPIQGQLALLTLFVLAACGGGSSDSGAGSVFSGSTGGTPEPTGSTATGISITKDYLMVFHACSTEPCGSPINHFTYLAESSDLTTWTMVSGWVAYQGSVPDVIRKGNNLYFFNPGTVRKLDLSTGTLGVSQTVSIKTSAGADVRFVDPSPILNADGKVALFYLDSSSVPTGVDPAGCSPSYPCDKNFGSALEVEGSNMTQFTADAGFRAVLSIASGSASDPDIFTGATTNEHVMYISKGNSIEVRTSSTLTGSYAKVADVNDKGGVPAGYHFGGQYWYFGALNNSSGGKDIKVYKAATIAGLASAPVSYTLTRASLPTLPASTKVIDSPGILKMTP